MLAADIKVVLLDSGYTYSAAHDMHDDITGSTIVATSGNLASKTTTAGTFDAADVVFSAVTGDTVTQFVIYKDTGVSSTSPLIAHFDTATGLSVAPNGGDITLAWNASGIFSI